MGGVSSCCKPPDSIDEVKGAELTGLGGGRRKNSYEPLLLENEREAVADLLQYLESESDPLHSIIIIVLHLTLGPFTLSFNYGQYLTTQTEQLQTSLPAHHWPRSPPSHFRIMSTFNVRQHWHSPK